ncbi:uncharacterized protein METZ01_LOCUS338676, partial [marine metagenome]
MLFSIQICTGIKIKGIFVASIFDSKEFNQNLFFPRLDGSTGSGLADEIFVEVEPKCRVHVRRHPSSKAKFSLLFFHGNGEIVSDYDGLEKYFNALGCELVVCDFRGYGRSEGTPTLRNALKDSSTIYRYLKNNGKLKSHVCVMGRSLGSAPAIELCVRFSEISCCVLESGYANPIPLVERRGLRIDKITPEENKSFNNSEKIRLITCPVLIMHGEEDILIIPQEAKLNHQNAGSKHKILDILKGVGHNDMMMAHDNA